MIEFIVEGKIVAKQSAKFTKNGFAYTPAHIKEYSNWVRLCFKQKYPGFIPIDKPMSVEIFAFFLKFRKVLAKRKHSRH